VIEKSVAPSPIQGEISEKPWVVSAREKLQRIGFSKIIAARWENALCHDGHRTGLAVTTAFAGNLGGGVLWSIEWLWCVGFRLTSGKHLEQLLVDMYLDADGNVIRPKYQGARHQEFQELLAGIFEAQAIFGR